MIWWAASRQDHPQVVYSYQSHFIKVLREGCFVFSPTMALSAELMETIDKFIGLPGSRWSKVAPEEAIADHVRDDARPKAQQRPMDCLVVCLDAEKEAAGLKEKRWAVTLPMLLDFVGQVATSAKNIGTT